MKRVLVPCDGSPGALRAVRLAATEAAATAGDGAALAEAEIQLLHVIAPMTAVTLAEAFSAHSLDGRFPPQAAQALEPAAAILAAAGLRYRLHCRFGDPPPRSRPRRAHPAATPSSWARAATARWPAW